MFFATIVNGLKAVDYFRVKLSFKREIHDHLKMTVINWREYTLFFYKNIFYKNIQDEIWQKIKNMLRISSSWIFVKNVISSVIHFFLFCFFSLQYLSLENINVVQKNLMWRVNHSKNHLHFLKEIKKKSREFFTLRHDVYSTEYFHDLCH